MRNISDKVPVWFFDGSPRIYTRYFEDEINVNGDAFKVNVAFDLRHNRVSFGVQSFSEPLRIAESFDVELKEFPLPKIKVIP